MSANSYRKSPWIARWLMSHWTEYWFGPSSATNLALCRVLVCGFYCYYFARIKSFHIYSKLKEVYWEETFLYYKLHLPVFSSDTIELLKITSVCCLAFAALGLMTRLNLFIATVTCTYLTSLPNNFGKTFHFEICIPFILIALCCSRCSDRLALDRRLPWGKRNALDSLGDVQSGAYRWPVRFVWLMYSLLFFAAGVSKLRHGGIGWMLGESMSNILRAMHYSGNPPLDWGLTIAEIPWLSRAVAVSTVALELFAPLAMISPRARAFLIPSHFFMLVGFYLVLGILPLAFFSMFIFWVPWDRVICRLSSFCKPSKH